MHYSINEVVDLLLKSYEAYYNINLPKDIFPNLVAVCEYYETSQKYVLSRKAELWSANSEEFIYLFQIEDLTEDMVKKCLTYTLEDGTRRSHIGPGHMYTYLTSVFICNSCDEKARKILRKYRYYKSFKFSLHGWIDFHAAVVEVQNNHITTNASGKCVGKTLKKVLFKRKGDK